MTLGRSALAATLALAAGAATARPAGAASCESLSSLRLSRGTITLAQTVTGGSFTPPASGSASPAPLADLPSFCRVAATLMPTADSHIKVEVWMPASGWTGRFVGVGNGGFGGVISYAAMASALRQSAATASTDTGHSSSGGAFGMNHPEKITDWASRSTHLMTEAAKSIVTAFYDAAPRYSYFSGCSTGGHQGLSEAQRYPADYDGILAGAHGANRTHLHASFLWTYAAARKDPASTLPSAKLTLLHDAVMSACDAVDGVKDGMLTNPSRCHFDPSSLRCKGADQPNCLTKPQVDAVKKVYGGMRNPRTKELLYPGWPLGSEATPGGVWADMSLAEPSYEDLFRYWVFENPQWDWRTFDFDKDMQKADEKLGATVNALSSDLSEFRRHGGKLLMYHGLNDNRVSAIDSIDYYRRVFATLPRKEPHGLVVNNAIRLFLVPGMGHCGGGPGPTTFDGLGALQEWVEKGSAPPFILGAHVDGGKATMTRPLCPYPKEAVFAGQGDTNDAANFTCRVVK
ncbi:MAG TPA: tannase/feruloyl esterase family alpha/beta hydrolase [Vicinamibacterales bacterium]